MSKVRRIFDIAKELNISHIEIIEFLKTNEDSKYTIMSSISNEIYAKILDEFYQDVSAVDRLRKEKARLNVFHPNQDVNEISEIDKKSEESKDIEVKVDETKERSQISDDSQIGKEKLEEAPNSKKTEVKISKEEKQTEPEKVKPVKIDIKRADNKTTISTQKPKRKFLPTYKYC